jgi:sugar phosphate isomerase/epimerase
VYTSFNARAVGLDLSARETIELAAEAGFDAVDLLVRDLVNRGEDPAELRGRMDDLGIRGGAWPLPVDWRSRNPTRFQVDVNRLSLLADVASRLGMERTGTWVYPELEPAWLDVAGPAAELENLEHDPVERAVSWIVSWLQPIVRVLALAGVRLGIEWIGVPSFRTGRPLPFVHSVRDPRLRQLVERLNVGYSTASPSPVGLLYDAFHLYAAGDFDAPQREWAEREAVWVHVADLPGGWPAVGGPEIRDDDRGLPGDSGVVPVSEFLLRLRRTGYAGPVTAEPLGTCRRLLPLSPRERAVATRDALRSVWPDW